MEILENKESFLFFFLAFSYNSRENIMIVENYEIFYRDIKLKHFNPLKN